MSKILLAPFLALHFTLPVDASWKVPVRMIGFPMVSILHFPKQGEGAWYIHQGRFQINVTPIPEITWDGNAFKFRMNVRFGRNAAFAFDVNGEARQDGTITGNVAIVDSPKNPFITQFEGSVRR